MNEVKIKSNSKKKIPNEIRKRKREIFLIFFVSLLLAILIGLEVYFFRSGQNLPAPYIIYFLALVNFNLVLVLFLLFLIFRNMVKIFLERRSRLYGSSLKSKFTIAFSVFSVVPTSLVLIISVFYLNSSFEKWFSSQTSRVLKNASEIVESLISQEKRKSFDYAEEIARLIVSVKEKDRSAFLDKIQKDYKLDGLEHYKNLFGDRILAQDREQIISTLPQVDLNNLKKSFLFLSQNSYIQRFNDRQLLRVLFPVNDNPTTVIVVSKILAFSSEAQLSDIIGSYNEYENNFELKTPIKSMYFIMMIVMSLVTLFAAIWFGFHLAKQLSVPLTQLGLSTKKVADGDYSLVDIQSGSEEINNLVSNFNQMIKDLSASEFELQSTLKSLHQYIKYVEIVLANVSAGVISVDTQGIITTMNRRASELLHLNSSDSVGKPIKQMMSMQNYQLLTQMLKQIRENKLSTLEKEIKVEINGETIPLMIHFSILNNELQEEIGRIIVFDDLTVIQNAQRAAAWSEVARRIAHEIKNPLTPIRLAAQRIHRKFSAEVNNPIFDESIQMIVTQVDEMKNLVNEFSQFARMPQLTLMLGNFSQVLLDVLKIFQNTHSHVQFKIELDSKLPEFKFDQSQIKRVFMNLIDNAIMACQNNSNSEVCILTEYRLDFKILKISVIDNGIGIPARDRAKVFEPYFSTKETGTGLGLSIVKSIIEDHSGIIRALPNEPTGTKMYIELQVIV